MHIFLIYTYISMYIHIHTCSNTSVYSNSVTCKNLRPSLLTMETAAGKETMAAAWGFPFPQESSSVDKYTFLLAFAS